MKLTRIEPHLDQIPEHFHELLRSATVFDSSCSQEARVMFIDAEDGYFLKSAPKGTLERENIMTRYFCGKNLAAQVVDYVSEDRDGLMTRRIHGEDCITQKYLDNCKKKSLKVYGFRSKFIVSEHYKL